MMHNLTINILYNLYYKNITNKEYTNKLKARKLTN